ncbi:SMEK domain-containing protein [Flagellimonas onchidii]|uniref:SMEK domain-containing protein n=1 Tax=Flagellimonas onchidii TaxID=2562684 RepID=UPI0014560FDD|nr:SMEK domain-containing protein [Allomuricauda onchidii]
MKSKKVLLDNISTKFGIIKEKLLIENSINDLSLNIHLENTYLKILNNLYGYNLKNANLFKRNFVAVDGVDHEDRVFVQVTSTFSVEKITATLKKIEENKLHDQFDTLIFIFLKGKRKLTQTSKTKILKNAKNIPSLDLEKHLLDHTDIYGQLVFDDDYDKIKAIDICLDQAIGSIDHINNNRLASLGISFGENDLDNVLKLILKLLNRPIVIRTCSYHLVESVERQNVKHNGRLVYATNPQQIEGTDYFMAIISNEYIMSNLREKSPKVLECAILEYAIRNDSPIQAFTFDFFLENESFIKLPQFISYQSIDVENINIDHLIEDITKEKNGFPFEIEKYKYGLIKYHSDFKLVEETPYKELKYNFYKFTMDEYPENEINYLIVDKGYNRTKVIGHFQQNYDLGKKPFTILLPKDELKTRKRIDNFKSDLSINRVHYIDEYLFDKLLQKVHKPQNFEDESFINPIILKNNRRIGLNDIMYWIIENTESTIAVLGGAGGMGKTTLCEKVCNEIVHKHKRYIVIFIDPQTFINAFEKVGFDDGQYDLYKVYEACTGNNAIEEEIFNINLHAGNIIIIFDGIDEVISTIESFNLNRFLEKISRVNENLGKGKILVNCRDSYIDDLKKYYEEKNLNSIEFYELLPFNKQLARDYFSKKMPNETKKINLSIKLLEQYVREHTNNTGYVYPPFVLESISSYVQDIENLEDGKDFEIDKFKFVSKLLINNDVTDLIIFNVCKREILKKRKYGFSLKVDDQVKFMVNLAVAQKGSIDLEDIKNIFKNIGIKDRIDRCVDTIKDHPFLYNENSACKFRFSFLKTHFESIGIYKLVTTPDYFAIKDSFIKALAIRGSYNSVTFKNIVQKLSDSNNDYGRQLNFGRKLIGDINKNISLPLHIKEKAISNLFVIFYGTSTTNNALLIKDLFANDDGIIENLFLVDIPENSGILIDFSDLILTHSKIENYPSFFQCKFNDGTFFDDSCEINKVFSNQLNYNKISADKSNFDSDIDGDNSIYTILGLLENIEERIELALSSFFECFYTGSSKHITDKITPKSLKSRYKSNISLETIKSSLQNHGIITKVDDKNVVLNKDFLKNINRYKTQGLAFKPLQKAMDEITNDYMKL